jgi:dethiobiotin synthetase
MKNSIAIVGIHTGIGKTVASAVLAEALGADYWKPVQAGKDQRDALLVRQWLTDGAKRVHDEAIVLSEPLSPHAAAAIDHVDIDYKNFQWPQTDKILLVETAGGILSPMSANSTMADFISHHGLPAILISMNYLGSINHTLMSIEVLKSRGIKLMGVILNGIENEQSEIFIKRYSQAPVIGRIPYISSLDNENIRKRAIQLKPSLAPFFENAND